MTSQKEVVADNVIRGHDYTNARADKVEMAYQGLLGQAENIREELKIIPLEYPDLPTFVQQFYIIVLDMEKLRNLAEYKKRQENRSQPRAVNG